MSKRNKIFKFLDKYKKPIRLHNEEQIKDAYNAFKKKSGEKSTIYYYFYLMYAEWKGIKYE